VLEDLVKNHQWPIDKSYRNLHITQINNINNSINFDCILVFNRASSFETAYNISQIYHLPIVVVDMVASMHTAPSPFFTSLKITNASSLFGRSGDISVGCSQKISHSWISSSTKLSVTANYAGEQFDINNSNKEKILIDPTMPLPYLHSLGIDPKNSNFTSDKTSCRLYVHLWKYITPMLIDCMVSGVPVVTFKDPELEEIINYKSCIIINDVSLINNNEFITNILNFDNLQSIIGNAKIYTQDIQNNFLEVWTAIFQYICNIHYTRG